LAQAIRAEFLRLPEAPPFESVQDAA